MKGVNNMRKYFRELLETLKSINETNKEINDNLKDISKCIVDNRQKRHGYEFYIATGHWND